MTTPGMYPPPSNPAPSFAHSTGFGGPQGQAEQYAGMVPKASTDAAAIVAFILALSSILLPVVPAIVALFLAPRAIKSIGNSEGTRSGIGLARASQIISALTIVLFALLLALFIVSS